MTDLDALAAVMTKIAELLGSTKPTDESVNTSHGITLKLNDSNYTVWSKLMETFIKGKKKLAFISGDEPPPTVTDSNYESWGAIDAAVRSWIQNSMDPTLIPNFASYETAHELWDAIATTYFDGDDMLRLYELERRVSRLRQAGNTIEQYYGELKSLWRDMDFIQPNPMKCTEDIKRYSDLTENRRVLQFPGDLEDRLDPIRRDLLNIKPFPTVDQAFAAVCREYQQQNSLTDDENLTGVGMVTKGKPSDLRSSLGGFRSKATGDTSGGNGGQGITNEKLPKCSHCGGKHQLETYFEVIGYPGWWKGKKGRASFATGCGGQPSADQLRRGSIDGNTSADVPSTTQPGSGVAANIVGHQVGTEGITFSHRSYFAILADLDEIGQNTGGGTKSTEILAAVLEGKNGALSRTCAATEQRFFGRRSDGPLFL